jgi:hypothetical protein
MMLESISNSIRKLARDLVSFRIERDEEEPVEDRLEAEPSVLLNSPKPSEYSTNTVSDRKVLDPESHKEKGYLAPPKIKPKRRSTFNKSETRGYRNEYQKEYRRENGNGYIKKPKKPSDSQESK